MQAGSDRDAQREARVVERTGVFSRGDLWAYVPLTLVQLAAIGWFAHRWLASGQRALFDPIYWLLSLELLYGFAINGFRWALLPMMSAPKRMRPAKGHRVGVATTFVPAYEPLEMLEVTVKALVAMDYPHDTWVLDEGDDPAVRALCERLGARHFTRKDQPAYNTEQGTFARRTKHGNYNAWLDAHGYDEYDVVVGFDPDHIPSPDFLDASLGYLDDPSVGYVQLPQVYYNQPAGFIARGAAEETYAYYSTTQMFSYTAGFPIVTGCHQTHRVTALKQVGGFAPHDADDLLITLLYRAAGWQGVYVPEIRAKGLTPTDWPSYLKQQLRWARSVIDIKLRGFRRVALDLPMRTRLVSLLHGFYYVQEGLLGASSIALLLYMLVTGDLPDIDIAPVVRAFLLVAAVQTGAGLYRQRFFLDPAREWGLHLRAAFLRFAKWPYILLGLVEALLGQEQPYSVTAKVRRRYRTLFTWPHLLVAAAIGLCWTLGALQGHPPPATLAWVAAGCIVASLVVVWTETWPAPPPFDPVLARSVLEPADPLPTGPAGTPVSAKGADTP